MGGGWRCIVIDQIFFHRYPTTGWKKLGLQGGVIICMKKGSTKWFHGVERKWKLSQVSVRNGPPNDPPPSPNTAHNGPRRKRVHYKIGYPDGGAKMWHAPPPRLASEDHLYNPNVTYCINGKMVLLPTGFIPGVEPGDEDLKDEY